MPNDEARTPTPDEIRTIADILSSYSVSSTGLDHYVAQLRRLADQLPAILTALRAAEELSEMISECWCVGYNEGIMCTHAGVVSKAECPWCKRDAKVCEWCRLRNALAALGEGPR